jgi:hypothetical protein
MGHFVELAACLPGGAWIRGPPLSPPHPADSPSDELTQELQGTANWLSPVSVSTHIEALHAALL